MRVRIAILTMLLMISGSVPSLAQQVYVICFGEYEANCKAHDNYQYCYVDPEKVATNLCQQSGMSGKHNLVETSKYGGNKCGYSIIRVICR